MIRLPPTSTLFLYTTLFRSGTLQLANDTGLAFNRNTTVTASSIIISDRLTRSEEHTSELQSRRDLVCRLLLEKKKNIRRLMQNRSKFCLFLTAIVSIVQRA